MMEQRPDPVFVHVAVGCFPPSIPLLVSHPHTRYLPTWLGVRDFLPAKSRTATVDERTLSGRAAERVPATCVVEEELWS